MSESATALCGALILLIPLAFAGLALMNAGLTRSRSAAHSLTATLMAAAVAAIAFAIIGFAWMGFPGGPAYGFTIGGKQWNWIGAGRFFLAGLDPEQAPVLFAACLGLFGAAFAAIIPLGALEERLRIRSVVLSAALMGGWTFPLFAHWVWGGGFLAQFGASYGLGAGFIDTGGAGTIQVAGGLTALSICWIVGPRRGKFNKDGLPAAIPGHNAVFVSFGALLALLGWFGLNAAGAILFYGASAGRVALVGINTLLGAGSALAAAAMITRTRFGKTDAWLSANGWTGGLVASSSCAAFFSAPEAIIVGLIAGVLVTFSVELLELHMQIDDPGGSISVHAVAGLWGLLAAGFLGRVPGSNGAQWVAQFAGIAMLLGVIFPMTYLGNWILNRFWPYRVSRDAERQGLDLSELGANAYPELATHLEDFTQR